jgi:hypothetical protein
VNGSRCRLSGNGACVRPWLSLAPCPVHGKQPYHPVGLSPIFMMQHDPFNAKRTFSVDIVKMIIPWCRGAVKPFAITNTGINSLRPNGGNFVDLPHLLVKSPCPSVVLSPGACFMQILFFVWKA